VRRIRAIPRVLLHRRCSLPDRFCEPSPEILERQSTVDPLDHPRVGVAHDRRDELGRRRSFCRETPIPGGRGIGVARMTGSTPPRTPPLGGRGGPRRIARLRARILFHTCHHDRPQSCPHHRTPRVTGSAVCAAAAMLPVRWSLTRKGRLVHVDQQAMANAESGLWRRWPEPSRSRYLRGGPGVPARVSSNRLPPKRGGPARGMGGCSLRVPQRAPCQWITRGPIP
jgi:hypothetical protein